MNKVIDSEVATITSKFKVLAIGDGEENSTTKNSDERLRKYFFKDEARKHLGLLLLGTRTPPDVVEDWDSVDRFGASSIKEDNKPRRYRFTCESNFDRGSIISGPTYNSIEVFNEVKKILKDENWISKDTIETPLRTKVGGGPFNGTDRYIQQVVSDALDAEWRRLFHYLLYLHRENKNKQKQ